MFRNEVSCSASIRLLSFYFRSDPTNVMELHSLAWAELFFAMGMMFRRFDYELYQTDESDVRYKYEFITPRVKLDSKGVRVSVI
jgi:hypothetical protein